MTLYRESMRRLFRVGMTLLALTLVATLICAISSAGIKTDYVISAFEMSPMLAVYAFIGGAGLAFAGFSFLNKRVESDFYHSIPVRRFDLYLSVTAAAATWMLITVALSSAVSAVVFLGIGRAFAPAYPFMNAGYFFAAALLVFAATAIGCTITGTAFTNVVMTCLVLFLPRYILFLVGRTLIADTGIMSWLDLRGFLDPTTNAATGVIVLLSRRILLGQLVSGVGILWSLALAIVELAVGALLFQRRPSELAEQGAGNRVLQIVFACLIALSVLLVYSVRAHVATTIFLCIILAAAFACYAIYQIIVLRNGKRVLLSLPWFLASVIVAAAITFGSQAAARRVLNVCPAADDIESVCFLGADRGSSPVSYATILTSQIEFSEEDVKSIVADTLREDIDLMNSYGYLYSESNYQTLETVRITLKNGRKLYRKLMFPDGKALNERRLENAAYAAAILTLPPDDAVKTVYCYIGESGNRYASTNLNTPELYALSDLYFGEQRAAGELVPYHYYSPDKYRSYEAGNMYYGYTPVNEEQSVGGFSIGGYIGTVRYHDSIGITLETLETASRYMELRNRFADDADSRKLAAVYKSAMAAQDDGTLVYYGLSFNILNCPVENGDRQWVNFNWYVNRDDNYDSPHQMPGFTDMVGEMVAIIQRATLTSDASRVAIMPTYSIQYADGKYENTQQTFYLALESADEARFLQLVSFWSQLSDQRYLVTADDADAATDTPSTSVHAPKPTPTPVPMPAPAG